MARYEVIARAKVDRRLSNSTYIDLALMSQSLDKGMRLQRIEDLPDGGIAIVLQHNLSKRAVSTHRTHQAAACGGRPAARAESRLGCRVRGRCKME